jgi:hypothetical protein
VNFVNNNDFFVAIGLASNIAGAFQGLQLVISLFEGSDTDEIKSAIQDLHQDMDRDFRNLGDLIATQIRFTVDTVNRDAMALALSRSDVAIARLQDFIAEHDAQALETAKSESIAGVSFFTELGLSAADLSFFLPGLIKAGTIRLFVIASEPAAAREPRTVVVDGVTSMINSLRAMIDGIKQPIAGAHRITEHSHLMPCAVHPEIVGAGATQTGSSSFTSGLPHRIVKVIDGYSHDELVIDPATNTSQLVQFEFFDAQRGHTPECEQPSGFEQDAQNQALQARGQGVTDEEAFVGVPGYEQVLVSWQSLLAKG